MYNINTQSSAVTDLHGVSYMVETNTSSRLSSFLLCVSVCFLPARYQKTLNVLHVSIASGT